MDNMRMAKGLQLNCGNISATGAQTEVNLNKSFVSPGKREMKAVMFAIPGITASDSGNFAYKLQASTDTVDSNFSDITGGGFTTVDTDNTTFQEIHFFTNKNYVRGYATLGATRTWDVGAAIFALKRDV